MLNVELQRRIRGISQIELGKKLNVDSRYISGIERGWFRPSRKFRHKCTVFFGLPEQILFTELPTPQDKK